MIHLTVNGRAVEVDEGSTLLDAAQQAGVHVPTVWFGMAGWTTIALASLAELVWRHPLAALAARSALAAPRRMSVTSVPRNPGAVG